MVAVVDDGAVEVEEDLLGVDVVEDGAAVERLGAIVVG